MIAIKMRVAVALLLGPAYLAGVPAANADPLIPPTPAEIEFLKQAHRALPGSGDHEAFKSDGELLDKGRYACFRRDSTGQIGYNATFISPIITQLAFVYLCP